MTTASAKAKGRRFQQVVRAALREVGKPLGLEDDDIKSTSMGVSGVDVQLSPLAQKVLGPLAIECKACEKLNVVGVYAEHASKYGSCIPLLFHTRNRSIPLVTLSMTHFLDYLEMTLKPRSNGETSA